MDLAKVQEVEGRYQAATAVVDAAATALAPLAAAHARGQHALFDAQRRLQSIAEERGYLQLQYQMENVARASRHELSQSRAIFEAPSPPGVPQLPAANPQPRVLGEDALREALAHVWLDRASETKFGLGAEYVHVGTDDVESLKALQEHVYATGGYMGLVRRFAHRVAVRD